MQTVLAIVLGLTFGAAEIALLIYGVRRLGAGRLTVWPFIVQFLCPLAGLLLCAFLARERLALCAVIMVAALLSGAVWEVLRLQRGKPKEKGRDSIGN